MTAVNETNGTNSGSPASLDEFLSKSFDYVICGGGTAGLVLAARLTENPDVNVGVLEAGTYKKNNPQVDTPAAFATMFSDENYDWNLKTVPQVRPKYDYP
jgi:choline dehydrogenase